MTFGEFWPGWAALADFGCLQLVYPPQKNAVLVACLWVRLFLAEALVSNASS